MPIFIRFFVIPPMDDAQAQLRRSSAREMKVGQKIETNCAGSLFALPTLRWLERSDLANLGRYYSIFRSYVSGLSFHKKVPSSLRFIQLSALDQPEPAELNLTALLPGCLCV